MQLHLDGVVEKGSMHGLSDDVHPSEGEGEVGQAAADPRARQTLLQTHMQNINTEILQPKPVH